MPITHHTQAVTPGKIPWQSYNENHDYSNLDATTLSGSTKSQIIEEAQEGMGGGEPGKTTIINKPADAQFSKGMILLWSGKIGDIPDGWHLCDGTQGTPDLTDRFIKGASSDSDIGDTGGKTTLQHSELDIDVDIADHPNHIHTYSDVIEHTHPITDPGHTHNQGYRNSGTAGTLGIQGCSSANNATISNGVPSKTTGITVDNPAGALAQGETDGTTLNHEVSVEVDPLKPHVCVEPPFYKLAFIMYLGGEQEMGAIFVEYKIIGKSDAYFSLGNDSQERSIDELDASSTTKHGMTLANPGDRIGLYFQNNNGAGSVQIFYRVRDMEGNELIDNWEDIQASNSKNINIIIKEHVVIEFGWSD